MRLPDGVPALTLSLVMAHQADAAYWKEWDMFGLAGEIRLFTLFNTEFHLPVSIAVITGTIVISTWQAIHAWRARAEFTGGA